MDPDKSLNRAQMMLLYTLLFGNDIAYFSVDNAIFPISYIPLIVHGVSNQLKLNLSIIQMITNNSISYITLLVIYQSIQQVLPYTIPLYPLNIWTLYYTLTVSIGSIVSYTLLYVACV